MQQGKALLHVAQAKALLELGDVGALAVIGEQQVDGAALAPMVILRCLAWPWRLAFVMPSCTTR